MPSDVSGGSTLITTFRPSRPSSARKTRLIPPPPRSRSMRTVAPRAPWSRGRRRDIGLKLAPRLQDGQDGQDGRDGRDGRAGECHRGQTTPVPPVLPVLPVPSEPRPPQPHIRPHPRLLESRPDRG